MIVHGGTVLELQAVSNNQNTALSGWIESLVLWTLRAFVGDTLFEVLIEYHTQVIA
jgi:hypothetical protein